MIDDTGLQKEIIGKNKKKIKGDFFKIQNKHIGYIKKRLDEILCVSLLLKSLKVQHTH